MKSAGGMQLLERWNDPLLTEINVDVHNAVSHYSAFYMLRSRASRIPSPPNEEAARAEMLGGKRNYLSARTNYRRAGGG